MLAAYYLWAVFYFLVDLAAFLLENFKNLGKTTKSASLFG
jgi:hypothetical protein